MFKWLIVSINLILGLFTGIFSEQEINVKVSAPTTVTAGDEFEVNIKLNKGSVASFSRLLQDLPAGLKATPVVSSNADFTFKDNKVRFIWLKLPDSDSITVTYKIKVDPRLKGTFQLGGRFSYISDNERQTIEANTLDININPNPNIDSKLIVDIKDFKELVIPELGGADNLPVACIRQTPQPAGDDDGSYVVNVLVYKENAQKFAKVEEIIPSGFTAIKIDSKEGIFVFKNGTAKILWMNLPQDPYFIVSYRLVPDSKLAEAPKLSGQFSYVADGKTIVKDVIQKDTILANLTADEIKKMVRDINNPVVIPVIPVIPVAAVPDNTKDTSLEVAQNVVKDTPKVKKEPAKDKKKWWQRKPEQIDMAYNLEPEDGIYFRVQLAAGHRPVNIKRYFKRFKIADEVRAEIHEGWHKYSIGSFKDYKQARDYRVHVWNTTKITDAFVAAYNTGKRITVQEALMVTNQQWYK